MPTLSTLSTLPPKPAQPQAVVSVQDIWKKYFDGKHIDVLNESSHALFTGNAPDYLHICGLSLFADGRIADAMNVLKTALLFYPQSPSWYSNCSIAALNAGALNESLEFATMGLQRHNEPLLYFSHGNALMHLGRLDEALLPFMKALELKSDFHEARLNLGNVLRRLGRSEDALSLYNQVLNMSPNNGLAMVNRAGVLIELARHDEASMLLLRIMATSQMPEVSFMMAMLRLIEGDFKNGFELYRSRFDCAMAAPDKAQFRKPFIENLDQAKTNHVLVSHEQGFGDTLQFIRYLPTITNKAMKISLLIPPDLNRLFANIDRRINIVNSRDGLDYDLECPMLHLPYIFETTIDTIPATIPYLSVPQEIISEHPLSKKSVPAPTKKISKKVGIAWAGQMRKDPDLASVDRRRSLHYKQIEPLLDVKNIDFYSLQLGEPVSQMEESTKGRQVPNIILDSSMDFMDTAAYIMQFDLIITVDTAVAHLAAALGKPVWVLSRFDQCWRWMKNRDDSPWYPNVLRLFHQEKRGDWSDTILQVKNELAKWAKK
jgi:tetratricopeptide (TPR) repeat protein